MDPSWGAGWVPYRAATPAAVVAAKVGCRTLDERTRLLVGPNLGPEQIAPSEQHDCPSCLATCSIITGEAFRSKCSVPFRAAAAVEAV
jgi:hypothetical protein